MLRRIFYLFTLAILLALSVLVAVAAADNRVETAVSSPANLDYNSWYGEPVTVITVTSGTDPNNSPSQTCYTDPPGPPGPATAPCTLRRAIVEANALTEAERPILIRFAIPAEAAEGYDATLDAWRIELLAHSNENTALGRLLNGQIIIDGATQPGGRSDGPKIILRGPGTGNRGGLIVGNTGHNNNVIRGLAFQNFTTHLFVNTSNNLIEDNWFGLSDNGLAPYLRNNSLEDGSGVGGIDVNSLGSNNMIRNNVFLGFDGVSAVIRGQNNVFTENLVGTRADGSMDKQTQPDLICSPVDWLGGGGVDVQGNNNEITDNIIAGLRQALFALSTQPSAIVVAADNVLVENNLIGIDGTGAEVGVCGRGIYLTGNNQPEHNRLMNNTVIEAGLSAISLNGTLVNGNTFQGNIIKRNTPWPQVEGNPAAEDAIQIGPAVPVGLSEFQPAALTAIDGTTISGSSGPGSPCPNCTIELFLDDNDPVAEALQSLAVVTANANGNWTAEIPFELGASQGIRTISTSNQFNTIPGFHAGTSTGLSILYYQAHSSAVFLPMIIR